ncbi:MAG: AAA family ATPase [Christensenellales bacterium]
MENVTVFESLDLELSSGLNIFIGENGTGKTHVMSLSL